MGCYLRERVRGGPQVLLTACPAGHLFGIPERLEQLDNLIVPLIVSLIDWKPTMRVTHVGVGTMVQEEFDYVEATKLGSFVKRGPQTHEKIVVIVGNSMVVISDCVDVATFVKEHLENFCPVWLCAVHGGMDQLSMFNGATVLE